MDDPEQMQTTRFPAGACDMNVAQGRARVLAGIRAGGTTPATFPKARASSGVCARAEAVSVKSFASSAVPLRGQRRFGGHTCPRDILLLPV